jgi:FlaG/FlaF family flagellin (archaellin)
MFHSFFKNKRGVSEIIANLLIVLIVSIAGAAIYSYSLTAFSSSTSTFQTQTDFREEQAQERLSIIAVWWDNSTGRDLMNLTVHNYGKIHLIIDAVYVNGIATSNYTNGVGTTVTLGNLVFVKYVSPIPIFEDETFEITVVTERGSKDAIIWTA